MNPNICRNCKADVTEVLVEGRNLCPACGWWLRMTAPVSEPVKQRWPRKRFLFVVFLCFLLGAPVNLALAGKYLQIDRTMALMIIAAGAIGSGFTLAKMVAKKPATFLAWGILFSIVVGALYFGAWIGLIIYAFTHAHGC